MDTKQYTKLLKERFPDLIINVQQNVDGQKGETKFIAQLIAVSTITFTETEEQDSPVEERVKESIHLLEDNFTKLSGKLVRVDEVETVEPVDLEEDKE